MTSSTSFRTLTKFLVLQTTGDFQPALVDESYDESRLPSSAVGAMCQALEQQCGPVYGQLYFKI